MEMEINDIYIPENYVKVWCNNKDDFLGTLEDDGTFFNHKGTLIVLGDGMAFMYMEDVKNGF